MAAWQTSDTAITRLDREGLTYQIGVKAIRTPEGKTVLTWLRMQQNEAEQNSYVMYMQVYDTDGKALLQKGGVVISSQPTLNSMTDYVVAWHKTALY